MLKRAIMVKHDNEYKSSDEAFYSVAGEDYAYLTNIKDLEINDFVVVDCANGLQVCRVTKLVGLTPRQNGKAFKWVIAKVDLEQHEDNKKAQEKIQELQNRVAIRKEQIEGQAILKLMAKDDPDMMELLLELRDIDKNLVPANLLEAPKKETSVVDNDGLPGDIGV